MSVQLTQPENKAFVNIASAVSSMTEDLVDAYWVTTKFYRHYRKHADVLHSLVSAVYCNDPKFSDRQVLASSIDPDQQSNEGLHRLHCLPF